MRNILATIFALLFLVSTVSASDYMDSFNNFDRGSYCGSYDLDIYAFAVVFGITFLLFLMGYFIKDNLLIGSSASILIILGLYVFLFGLQVHTGVISDYDINRTVNGSTTLETGTISELNTYCQIPRFISWSLGGITIFSAVYFLYVAYTLWKKDREEEFLN